MGITLSVGKTEISDLKEEGKVSSLVHSTRLCTNILPSKTVFFFNSLPVVLNCFINEEHKTCGIPLNFLPYSLYVCMYTSICKIISS